MNTLLVLPWDVERGGIVSVAENLARYLQMRGRKVLFLHVGPSVILKTYTNKLGFPAVQLRLGYPFAQPRPLISAVAFPFLSLLVLIQLIWLLRKYRIQIVNLHYLVDNFFYFGICRRLLSIRLVTSIHGADAFYRGSPRKYSRAFRFLMQSADLIILPSDAYRKKLLEALPNIQEKTIFIHNGINPIQFKPDDGQNSGPSRYILCIAELREPKAIDVLLRAGKLLLPDDRSLTLVLAGDGPLRQELEALAVSLGIAHQTHFLGNKKAPEIVRLLHGCEVVVLPSREETFGIAVIEAMACKKPVVATKVGGIPEVIEHEVSGILVEPENPLALAEGIRRVLTNNHLKRTLAENGYARAMERFCFHHNGKAYEAAFASVLGLQTS